MWSDSETTRDCLGYSAYVDVLAEVCTHSDLAPLALGVFGSWGSGKTSLMRMMEGTLGQADGVETLWFNAWRYEGREEAQSALIHAIVAALKAKRGALEEAAGEIKRLVDSASVLKLAKFIGKTAITMTPDLGGFLECFSEESEKLAETMEQFESDFAALLDKVGLDRIVVFIDDLDRCSNSKVIETFETIKLFLNTPRCTFVIGADSNRIEAAVGAVYNEESSDRRRDYLEKIVQIPFRIPEQGLPDIECYVGMLTIEKHLDETGKVELSGARAAFYGGDSVSASVRAWPKDNERFFEGGIDKVTAALDEVMPFVGTIGRGLRGNPRQIKRLLNVLAMRRLLAGANDLKIASELLIKLTVLEYVWPDFFEDVVSTVDPKTGRTDLVREVLEAATKGEAPEDSQLVVSALERSGLVAFLGADPRIPAEADLSPYLFLAQTSLVAGRSGSALAPTDETARTLAAAIQTHDRVRSTAAGRRAAAQAAGVADAVVRILTQSLPSTQNSRIRTHTIGSLQAICESHPQLFGSCVHALDGIDASGDSAVAIAAGALLRGAADSGVDVPDALRSRFAGESKIAAALDRPRRKGSRSRKP